MKIECTKSRAKLQESVMETARTWGSRRHDMCHLWWWPARRDLKTQILGRPLHHGFRHADSCILLVNYSFILFLVNYSFLKLNTHLFYFYIFIINMNTKYFWNHCSRLGDEALAKKIDCWPSSKNSNFQRFPSNLWSFT